MLGHDEILELSCTCSCGVHATAPPRLAEDAAALAARPTLGTELFARPEASALDDVDRSMVNWRAPFFVFSR